MRKCRGLTRGVLPGGAAAVCLASMAWASPAWGQAAAPEVVADGAGVDAAGGSARAAASADGAQTDVRRVLSPRELRDAGLAELASGGCSGGLTVNTDPEGDGPTATVFSPDGELIYVSHRCTRNIIVYDAETRDFVEEITLSDGPADVAITPDGTTAVTANIFDNTASIVDLAAGTEVASIPVGEGAATVRITPDGQTALVGSLAEASVSVIDIASQAEVRRIEDIGFFSQLSVNFEAFAVAVVADNPLAVAGNSTAIFPDRGDDQIQFIDIATGSVTGVASALDPGRVAVTPDGSTAVVSHVDFGSAPDQVVSVVDVASQAITQEIPIGERLTGPIAMAPDGSKAAVAVQNATRIVDLADGSVSPPIDTASVNELATTADGQHALGVGFRGALVSYASESLVANLNNVVSTSTGSVSPAGSRAAMISTTFGNDLVVVDTDGASGGLEGVRNSGPAPEGDKPRTIGVSPDGSRVAVANTYSDNVAVFGTDPQALLGYADIGDRAGQVEVTPDGGTAVVANRDSTFVSLVDLDALTTTEVGIGTRGDQVEISPDGQYAYIAVVANGDGVWRVNLDAQSVEGPKLLVGQMGGLATGRFSGMALSHDGSTLVTCDSFDDQITLIDTGSWSVVTSVPVGDFPLRAAFSPDDSTIYVSNRFGGTVSFVANDGVNSAETAVVPASDDNRTELIASPDGSKLYAIGLDEFVDVIDTGSASHTGTITLQDTASGELYYDAQGRLLIANGMASASTAGGLTFEQTGRISAIDPETDSVVEEIPTGELWGRELAVSADGTRAATANLAAESVSISQRIAPPCAGDFNGDGTLDSQDFLDYIDAFAAGDPSADLDGNGSIGSEDFLAFIDAFAAGCP